MDLRAPLLLLLSSGIVHMSDLNYNLTCFNDYVSTLHCTLEGRQLTNTNDTFLKLREADEESVDILCPLSLQMDRLFCSADVPIGFLDTDEYAISLCHHDVETCELLMDDYYPADMIKPKTPGNLAVSFNSSLCIFSWKSNYENYRSRNLYNELRFELLFHERGQGFNETSHLIIDQKTTATVRDVCSPGSECVAKIRSCPNSQTYRGVWSDWSTEIYWKKPLLVKEVPLVFYLEKVIIPVCVLVPCLFVLCFIPLKKWRRTIFIPTPAPYFYTLYNDFQGDFKSWVVMEKNLELPKTEPTLHIDNMIECEDVCAAAPCDHSGVYANMSQTEPDQTLGLDSATASCTSAEHCCLSPQSRSPAEDSGCWLSSDQTLGTGPSWYCNNYCTLSTFQQTALATSEPLKCATGGELHVMEEIEL
ncbi:unnamed protein product [Knipowitschia caucasica]